MTHMHEADESCQSAGTVSVTVCVVSIGRPIAGVCPVPVIV